MVEQTLYLIRHAAVMPVEWNYPKSTPLKTIEDMIPADIREGSKGLRMIKLTAKYLAAQASLGEKNIAIYSSPLQRAQDLTSYVQQALQHRQREYVIHTLEELTELDPGGTLADKENVDELDKTERPSVLKYFSYNERGYTMFAKSNSQVKKALQKIVNCNESLSQKIVISHQRTLALLWFNIINGKREITRRDYPELERLMRNIPFASISTVRFIDEKVSFFSYAMTNHLPSELVGGIY